MLSSVTLVDDLFNSLLALVRLRFDGTVVVCEANVELLVKGWFRFDCWFQRDHLADNMRVS